MAFSFPQQKTTITNPTPPATTGMKTNPITGRVETNPITGKPLTQSNPSGLNTGGGGGGGGGYSVQQETSQAQTLGNLKPTNTTPDNTTGSLVSTQQAQALGAKGTFEQQQDPLGGFSPVYEKGNVIGFNRGGEFIPRDLAIDKNGMYNPAGVSKGQTTILKDIGFGGGTATSYTGFGGTTGELISGGASSTFNIITPNYFASYKMTPIVTTTSTSSDIIMPQSQEELNPYSEFMKGRNFFAGTYEYGTEWLSRNILGTTQQRVSYSDIAPYKLRGSISPNVPTFSLINSEETKSIVSLRNIQAQQSLSTSIGQTPFIFASIVSSAGLKAITGIQMASFGVEKFTTSYGKEQANVWEKEMGVTGKPLYYVSGGLEILGGISQLNYANKLAQVQALENAPKLSVTTINNQGEFSILNQRTFSRAKAPYIFSMGEPTIYSETRATASLFPSVNGNLYTIESGRLGTVVQFRNLLNQPYYFESQATFSGTLWGTQGRYISKTGGITLEQEAMKSYTGKIKITSMNGIESISKRFGGYSLTNLGEGKSEILMSGDISKARIYYSEDIGFKAQGLLKPNTLTSYKEFTATEPSGTFRIIPSSKTGQISLSPLERPIDIFNPQQLSINAPTNLGIETQFKTGELIPLSKTLLKQIGNNLNKGFIFKSVNVQKQVSLNKDFPISKSPLITKSMEITKQVSLTKDIQINVQSQPQVTKQVSITKLINPSPTSNITPNYLPTIPPIIPPIIPPLPKFDFGESLGSRKFGAKGRRKYTPSFEALIFNIKGKQPKSPAILALGTRPITKKFKWEFGRIKL